MDKTTTWLVRGAAIVVIAAGFWQVAYKPIKENIDSRRKAETEYIEMKRHNELIKKLTCKSLVTYDPEIHGDPEDFDFDSLVQSCIDEFNKREAEIPSSNEAIQF